MRGDRSLEYAKYALADRLHKTLPEIEAMTLDEWNGWQAFAVVTAEKRKG